jgi:asparagine synthase (glutamine-hydrolysing)
MLLCQHFLRTFYTASSGFVKYYRPDYEDYLKADQELNLEDINSTLTNAVSKRLMADASRCYAFSGFLIDCIDYTSVY